MKSPIIEKILEICREKKITPQIVISLIERHRLLINWRNSHIIVEIINSRYELDIYDYREYVAAFRFLLSLYPFKM